MRIFKPYMMYQRNMKKLRMTVDGKEKHCDLRELIRSAIKRMPIEDQIALMLGCKN